MVTICCGWAADGTVVTAERVVLPLLPLLPSVAGVTVSHGSFELVA